VTATAQRCSTAAVSFSGQVASVGLVVTITLGLLGSSAVAAPNHTSASQSHKVAVLGAKDFSFDGRGYGEAHPRTVFNGGDPAGLIKDIRWKRWGAARSIGWGRAYAYKPHGGYYKRTVKIEVRTQNLGHCVAGSPAYTHLFIRKATKPGGQVEKHWHTWTVDNHSLCRKNGVS
jgi:hypothetical protein